MFESYHALTDKHVSILSKYKVEDLSPEEPELPWSWDFYTEFRERAKLVLGKSYKATPRRWLEILVFFVGLLASAVWSCSGSWWGAFAFPLAYHFFTFNTFHDATHFSLSNKPWVNQVFSYTALFITSPTTWYHQHVIGHHTRTNIHKQDPDLHHGNPLFRISVTQWPRKHYKYQMLYLAAVWGAMTWLMAYFIDFFTHQRGSYHNIVPLYNRSTLSKLKHFIARSLIFLLNFVPNLLLHGVVKGIAFNFIFTSVLGICFAMVTQVNHLTDESTVNNGEMKDSDWGKHQIVTSHDFAVDSLFWFYFSGGLNQQIEHHLLPSVCACHLRKLHPLVQELCTKYGVPMNESNSFWEALRKHLKYMMRMATGDQFVKINATGRSKQS